SQFDDRAARLAAAYDDAGLRPDSKIGLYLYNGNEYLEAQYAGFKMRGVPVNVNYRYLDEELRYLLDNADAEALVFHASLGDRVARIVDLLPKLKLLIEVDDVGADGTHHVDRAVRYEDVVAGHDPMPRLTRDEGDVYMLYTGGTTGMPKGVMYRIGDMTGGLAVLGFNGLGLPAPESADEIPALARKLHDEGANTVSITGAPLMHGTGLWLGAFIHHLAGGHVVTLTSRSLDADEMLTAMQEHHVTHNTIVGDSFSKPIIAAIDAAIERREPYDTSDLKMMLSSGVMWTTEVKEALLDRIPQAILLDAIGSSEGSMGNQVTMRGMPSETAKFTMNPTTKVFKDDDTEVTPGSDEIGMVAAGGLVPIGYFKDPEKSARTFRTIAGERYSFPGDFAQVAADGTLILLGRGSQVINSGGEKIFPEEVEEAVKRCDGVVDCLVVGVDDDKFGQAVTAIASLADGATTDEATVIASVKAELAGFKAPKRVVFVPTVPRSPNGKADYRAARSLAESSV
ncbi:MAG: AMP-binding protein, partial [Ilumatobacter sp.]|nr:AMP-binding protein [Ilumatobacter sp.]